MLLTQEGLLKTCSDCEHVSTEEAISFLYLMFFFFNQLKSFTSLMWMLTNVGAGFSKQRTVWQHQTAQRWSCKTAEICRSLSSELLHPENSNRKFNPWGLSSPGTMLCRSLLWTGTSQAHYNHLNHDNGQIVWFNCATEWASTLPDCSVSLWPDCQATLQKRQKDKTFLI